MTYEELKSKGTKIYDEDCYDGGIYLNTTEYWACNGILYIHEEHPNDMRYTGRTKTYQPAISFATFLINDYLPNYLYAGEATQRLKELTNY